MKFLATIKLNNIEGNRTHFAYVEADSMAEAMQNMLGVATNEFVAVTAHTRTVIVEGANDIEYGVVFPATAIREVVFQEV